MSILSSLLAYTPGFIANATPVILVAIPSIRRNNRPIAARALGSHKTWAGLIGGVITGMLMGTLLATLPPLEIAPLLRSLYPTPPMGALTGGVLGFGALAGDMAKSFFKRRLKREEGSPFFPWDSLDYVIGMLVFGLFLHVPSWQECLVILAAGPLFSLLSNVTAYSLGLKDVWY